MFYTLKLTYPGRRLSYSDQDWAWQTLLLIQSIERTLNDAAIALSYFENQKLRHPSYTTTEQWLEDIERRKEIENQIIEQQSLNCNFPNTSVELSYQSQVKLSQEKWEHQKELPDCFQDRFIFIYAQSYMYSMNRLRCLIDILNKKVKTNQEFADEYKQIKNARKNFMELMPHLREVRDSSAHYEDRIRGLGKNGTPINSKIIENEFISIADNESSVIISENLHGNCFGGTLADGNYGEVEISFQVFKAVYEVVQNIFNAFQWKGTSKKVPIYIIY